jgi:hypothetical protein
MTARWGDRDGLSACENATRCPRRPQEDEVRVIAFTWGFRGLLGHLRAKMQVR